jgi:transcriptional regulator with XRE-family HTH domain
VQNGVDYQLNIIYRSITMEATFGQLLKELRRSKNVSQRDLAARVGVDFSYISKLENDRLPPPAADTAVKICQVLGVEPDDLLSVTGKVPSEVKEMLTGNPSALQFVRQAQRMGLTSSDWGRLGRTLRRLRKG